MDPTASAGFAFLFALAAIAAASVVVMYACDSFEEASQHLGRNMPPGVKGATINAVGSSLPELFTTAFLLFFYRDLDGFTAGIATCAGSAIFNAVIIPALCILAVTIKGVGRPGARVPVTGIEIERSTLLRDGLFFVLAEVLLIYFLNAAALDVWMSAALVGLYAVYFGVLMLQFRRHGTDDDSDDAEDDAPDDETKGWFEALATLDFNALLFGGRPLNNFRAWVVLGCATVLIALACKVLADAVMDTAAILDVPPYFTAVILAAAATSVPDTWLSVKDALAGEYDDAVANAFGSNIFDITVALGLPLFLFTLSQGALDLSAQGDLVTDVRELSVALVGTSALVLGLFVFNRRLGRSTAIALIAVYALWTAFILTRAF